MRNHRWFVNIDHLREPDLEFMGWYKIAEGDEVSVYRRPYDGEEQVIANGPPRFMVVDDYNDAVTLSSGHIIVGPENSSG